MHGDHRAGRESCSQTGPSTTASASISIDDHGRLPSCPTRHCFVHPSFEKNRHGNRKPKLRPWTTIPLSSSASCSTDRSHPRRTSMLFDRSCFWHARKDSPVGCAPHPRCRYRDRPGMHVARSSDKKILKYVSHMFALFVSKHIQSTPMRRIHNIRILPESFVHPAPNRNLLFPSIRQSSKVTWQQKRRSVLQNSVYKIIPDVQERQIKTYT